MIVIDLSLELAAELPCWWPGCVPFSTTSTTVIGPESGPGHSRSLVLEEHTGTHMDAPRHIADASLRRPVSPKTVMDIPLGTLVGRARVIDVRGMTGTEFGKSPWVEVAEFERFEAESGAIRAGDAVLLWTGWSDERYRELPAGSAFVADPVAGRVPGWPAASAEFVSALASRGVTVLGVDTPSLGATQDPLSAHRAALSAGITPVEGLTNLGAISQREAFFVFLPLPIRDGSGAPGRAVALIQEDAGVSEASVRFEGVA